MERQLLESTLTPAERKFLDLMRHGDNFLRIELLRPAKSYYKKALELSPNTKEVQMKIAECERLLAFESKVIRILVVIGVIIIIALLLI